MKSPSSAIHILPIDSSGSMEQMRESELQHSPYQLVHQIYDYVKNGDVEKIRSLDKLFYDQPITIGHMSRNAISQAKYASATTAGIATYISIENGLSEEYAYSLSDLFIQEIDKLNDVDTIYNKSYQFLIQITELMYALSHTTKHPVILKCIHYIQVHLYHEIRVQALAEECGLSRSRLSVLFKKETGLTINEFIQKERCKEARDMLISGHYDSIGQIAYLLNFCSQSYFSECFKKIYGISPNRLFQRNLRH